MLTIRLQRVGKIKHAVYRLIISEKGRDTRDKYLENLGSYNPHNKVSGFAPKAERIKYWISKGATLSNTVNNLLVKSGIINSPKKKSVYISKARQAKLAEKSKAKAAKPAEAAAAPAPSPVAAS